MKTIIFLLMFFPMVVNAWEVQLKQMSHINSDDYYQVANWQGLQVNYDVDDYYVFGSVERGQIIPLWGIGDLSLFGAGIGTRFKVHPKITFFGQLGYYYADHEDEGRHRGHSEGLTYYMNSKYGFSTDRFQVFDEYQIEYGNAVGGEVGVIFQHKKVGFLLSYRSIKIDETFRVMKDEWNFDLTGVCWEQEITRDFSSINFGINIKF